MTKEFRLTIHHDEDAYHLNPNEEDSPLFKLHSFNTGHNNFTDPNYLLACEFKDNDGGYCENLPHDPDWLDPDDPDLPAHDYQGPEGHFLSYFEHGSCKWGLSGTMNGLPDFKWDGVAYAGFLEVTVPDNEREWWDGRPEEDRIAAAESFVSVYTDWCNGEVYGFSLEKLEREECDLGYVHEENEDLDSCWGFIGFDSIQEEVQGVTHFHGATEENTEIVDKAYGVAEYGRWFVTEEEAKEINARLAKNREGVNV